MSSNELEGGGSGGGDYGDDGSSGGARTIVLQLPREQIRRIAKGVVFGLVPGWIIAAEAFQSWPSFTAWLREFVIQTVVGWVVNEFVRPLVRFVLEAFALVIETIRFVAFGSDGVIGGSPGVADFVVWLADVFVAVTAPLATVVIDTVKAFNGMLADLAAAGGLPAPIVVSALVAAELLAVAYLAWTILSVIDLPLVDVDNALAALLLPFKKLLRRLS